MRKLVLPYICVTALRMAFQPRSTVGEMQIGDIFDGPGGIVIDKVIPLVGQITNQAVILEPFKLMKVEPCR